MPLLYDTDSFGAVDITGSGEDLFLQTMTANGRIGASVMVQGLNGAAATLTLRLTIMDGSENVYGVIDETVAKPTGATRAHLESERPIFLPSGFKLGITLLSTGSNNTSVGGFWYLFDPNHGSDLSAVGGETLGSNAGENFNTLFDNDSAASTLTLDSLVEDIVDAVWEESWVDHYEVTDSFAQLMITIATHAAQADANAEQILQDTGTTGVVVAAASKTGYSLASNGMDSVTLPAGIITGSSINNGAITNAKFSAGAIDAAALAADVVNKIWMGTALTESYAADGATATPAQLLYMLLSACTQFDIDDETIRCRKLDGSTEAMTFSMNSATNPTLRFRSS